MEKKYCELCKIYIKNFSQHRKSLKHQRYLKNLLLSQENLGTILNETTEEDLEYESRPQYEYILLNSFLDQEEPPSQVNDVCNDYQDSSPELDTKTFNLGFDKQKEDHLKFKGQGEKYFFEKERTESYPFKNQIEFALFSIQTSFGLSDEILQTFLNMIHAPFFEISGCPKKIEEIKLFKLSVSEGKQRIAGFQSELFPSIMNYDSNETLFYFNFEDLIQLNFANPKSTEHFHSIVPTKSPEVTSFNHTQRCRTNSFFALDLIRRIKEEIGMEIQIGSLVKLDSGKIGEVKEIYLYHEV